MVTKCTQSSPPFPWNEQERLAALRGYEILDTDREVEFDDIARIAAQICDAPIAVVNFVEEDRQWFKSEIGLGVRQTPLNVSICAHAILQEDLFIVPDTTIDARFSDNPLVTGEPRLRFYAGALLKTPSGLPLGTVCVLGTEARPKGLTSGQADALSALARSVMRELELRVANQALRASEERLRLALQAGRMVAWERNLPSDFVTRSETAKDLLGIVSGPVSNFIANLHPEDRTRARARAQGLKADREEMRYVHPDNGRTIWLSARSITIPEVGEPKKVIGVTFDITDRKLAEDELWHMANHDALTGLANRMMFQRCLEGEIEAAESNGTSVSLLLLDLDDFKSVNDTLGHDAGDALLVEMSRRLSGLAGEGDTIARLGGDEFAIIKGTDLKGAMAFADRITEVMARRFNYLGHRLATKASIGIASFPDHHRSAIELMKDADIALYHAKAERRGCAVVYTEAARERIEQRVRLLAEVREGLTANQFVPFYQPKVSLQTGQIVGLEALARWQHPERGVLTPGAFGPAFADPETATAMGARMIVHVARDIGSWLTQGLECGRVAMNFASAEFANPHLAKYVLGALWDAGVPTRYFEVEVTESVFLDRGTETALAVLQEFASAGVSIALDDFGTGFASLTHLKRYPVNHIKIDQSFVRELETDKEDSAIVSAVIRMGQSLGMEVTAEGVETHGQARVLTEMGCGQAQGYLYAKPIVGSRIPWLLSNWQIPGLSEPTTEHATRFTG
ncbi:EAL domain-containing protein [Bosea sp. AAP35]|uniref:putative bifunctional diguanylate cyclase/phosphodiesterase n=1 Tax=Bosea sp. AAP35 TaxID=1523417 RepID=UPI0009E692F6|nr:EAL domain-containing protein [Bosea sp. AAP35]